MGHEYITIPKKMYLWAIERAGYNSDEFLTTHPDVAMYAEGEKTPTINQLERFANTVHVPMAFLMMPEPPSESSPIPMFRRKSSYRQFDLNAYQMILSLYL